jgi:hypothetical protein
VNRSRTRERRRRRTSRRNRSRRSKERHPGLAGDGPGQQGLAGAGRAGQQHAGGDAAAEPREFLRVFEEIDDLLQLLLGLVDAGHVLEGDLVVALFLQPGPVLAERRAAPPLPPPCIWRMKKIHTPISSSIGNQETKIGHQSPLMVDPGDRLAFDAGMNSL